MSNEREWDIYFIRLAKEVSKHSHCLSRKIGAVIVKDKNVVSTGYNGPPARVRHCNERDIEFYAGLDNKAMDFVKTWDVDICPRRNMQYKSGEGLHLCQAGHAERNAILQAAKHGIATKGASLYCSCGQVCKDCAIEIINAGIKELVYIDGCKEYDKYSGTILTESGITIRKVPQIDVD